MERDFEAVPYTDDEAKVAKYLAELTGIGAGDDPIAFIIASHALSREEIRHLRTLVDELENYRDELKQALHRIKSWSEAYPLEVFPEPDLVKARQLLEAGGLTLDAISAHCMRHVVEGVGLIARDALEDKP